MSNTIVVTDKKKTSVLKFSTYINTSIAALPFGLATILAFISVSAFKTAVILYVSYVKL